MHTAKHTNTKPKLPRMSDPHYEPKIGDTITVHVPDEVTRAVIEKIVSDTAVIARLNQYLTSKTHMYRKGELIPCKYEVLSMNQRGWRAVSERELADSQPPAKRVGKKGK